MTIARWARLLHMDLPVKVCRWSPLFCATLADGLYLTAWPLWSLLAPIVVFVFALSVGAFHWLPMNIWNGITVAHPAVAFMQMLPLLVVAVALGALSAGLGLILVIGYALGDLLVSGATYSANLHHVGAAWWLLHVTTAQLISYGLFFLLAVQPALMARALSASLPRIPGLNDKARVVIRSLLGAAITGLMVYAWTLMAPMAIRPLWLWVHSSASPVSVHYFTSVVNPMLPLVAAGFALVRSMLTALAKHSDDVERDRSARRCALAIVRHAQRPGRLPAWSRALFLALVTTLLLAGLIAHPWPAGVLVFASLAIIFVVRTVALPRWAPWRAWAAFAGRIPLLARWVVAIVGSYLIGKYALSLHGHSVAYDRAAGAFGVELIGIILGLAFAAVIFPAAGVRRDGGGAQSGNEQAAVLRSLALFGLALLALHPLTALASCVAPHCCFGTNRVAILDIAAFAATVLSVFLFGPEFLIGLVGELAGDELGFESVLNAADAIKILGESLEWSAKKDYAEVAVDAAKSIGETVLDSGVKDVVQGQVSSAVDHIREQAQQAVDGALGLANGTADYSAIGPLSLAQPGLPAQAVVQLGAADGLQSSSAGAFTDVRHGQAGDPNTAYLWTLDQRGINIVPASASVPGGDSAVAITNLSTSAASGGQVWFGPDRTVVIRLQSGQGFTFEHSAEQWQALIRLWESLGYTVQVQGAGA